MNRDCTMQLIDTHASVENATQTGSQKLYKWITTNVFNKDFIKVIDKAKLNNFLDN